MKHRFGLTIYHKLIALIVALMLGVVGGLASYLSSQQIHEMTAALRTRAETYGSVMANQTTSAVAFSDRETAREVLRSINADGDVASVVLYGEGGIELYRRGEGSLPASTPASAAPRRRWRAPSGGRARARPRAIASTARSRARRAGPRARPPG